MLSIAIGITAEIRHRDSDAVWLIVYLAAIIRNLGGERAYIGGRRPDFFRGIKFDQKALAEGCRFS